MPGILFPIGILLGLIALAASKARAASAPAGDGKDSLKKIIASKDPRKIAAASIAAKKAGNKPLGQALAKAAKGAAVSAPGAAYKSPFPKVSNEAWTAYVHGLRGRDPKAITPAYYLGLFGFGMRRLVDLGLAKNPVQVEKNGRKVWDATWIPSLTPGPEKFLADADLQYQTFIKSTTADARAIGTQMPKALGSEIGGVKATLSGLLAVAKQAGIAGLKSWATDEETRKKYPNTSAVFAKMNGIF